MKKRFQVRWTQYLWAGNHFFDIEDGTQTLCSFETPVYAETKQKARDHIFKLFGRPRIISIDEFTPDTKVGWF